MKSRTTIAYFGTATLALTLLASSSLQPAHADDGVTPYRALVAAKRAAMMERATGIDQRAALDKPRIIGGTAAPAARYRFQVGLLDATNPNNFNAQFCGGTLIHRFWVLTAAHCTDFLTGPDEVEILTGTNDLTSGGTRRTVTKIVIHPGWNPNTNNNDVALLKLGTATTNLPFAKLITLSQEGSRAEPGDSARTVGWGDTDPTSATSFPSLLRHVLVPIVSRSDCNDANSYNGDITTRMICAGFAQGGKDSCQGDSGGPLLVAGADGKFTILAGVVSFGIGCALPNFPGVYSRVAVLRTWILGRIAAL